jgi:hypothetical protein
MPMAQQPVMQSPPPAVVYAPAPTTTTTVVAPGTVTQTTRTTTTTSQPTGAVMGTGMNVSVNDPDMGVNFNMNVGIPVGTVVTTGGTVQQTTTTASLWVQTGGTTSDYVIADFRTGTNLPALHILGNGNSIFSGNVTLSGNLNLQGAVTRNINFYDSSNTNINAQIQYDQISSTSGQLLFGTNNAGTFATRLTISNTGAATFSGQIISTLGNNLNIFKSISATTGYQSIHLANTSGNGVWILGSSTGTEVFSNGSAYATQIGTLTATSLQFGTNSSIALTIGGY